MKLKEYLKKNRIDPDVFAIKCGLSVSSIYRLLRGGRMNYKTACIIEDMTNKAVSLEELPINERQI